MSKELPFFVKDDRPDLCCGRAYSLGRFTWSRQYLSLPGLVYVIRGDGRIYGGDRMFVPRKDMLLLLKPNVKIKFEALEDWELYWFHFLMTPRLDPFADLPEALSGVSAIQFPAENFVRPMLEDALRLELTRPKHWNEAIFSMLDCAILYARTHWPDAAKSGDVHIRQGKELLSGIKEYSMDELARICNMSRAGFFAKFKAETGMSPRSYRELVMMRKAQRLLEEPGFSVAEIANCIGMKNCGYFSTRFRHIFGMSPQEYRRDLKLRGKTPPDAV